MDTKKVDFLREVSDAVEAELRATGFKIRKIPSEYRLRIYDGETLAIEIVNNNNKWKIFSTDTRYDEYADRLQGVIKPLIKNNGKEVLVFYA